MGKVIGVTFPNSHKVYNYLIPDSLNDVLWTGDKVKIRNDSGYTYRDSYVTVRSSRQMADSDYEYKVIVAIKRENDDFWLTTNLKGQIIRTLYSEDIPNDMGDFPIAEDVRNNFNKGDNTMNKIFGNLEFGKVNNKAVAYSIKGMAYSDKDGRYFALDPNTKELIEVSDFIMDMFNDYLYKMPVAIDKVSAGDIIIHNGNEPLIVTEVVNGHFKGISPRTKEVKEVLPARNIFGFNFVTKIVSFVNLDGFFNPNTDNPFGSMLPFMLLKDSNSNFDMKDLFLAQVLGGNTGIKLDNPMMLLMLSEGKMNDMLPMLMMMNGGFDFTGVNKE